MDEWRSRRDRRKKKKKDAVGRVRGCVWQGIRKAVWTPIEVKRCLQSGRSRQTQHELRGEGALMAGLPMKINGNGNDGRGHL